MNGGKEEKTGRIQIRRIRSRQIGRFYTMNCLDFVLDEIKPLGFLNLDMEGW